MTNQKCHSWSESRGWIESFQGLDYTAPGAGLNHSRGWIESKRVSIATRKRKYDGSKHPILQHNSGTFAKEQDCKGKVLPLDKKRINSLLLFSLIRTFGCAEGTHARKIANKFAFSLT